MYALTTALYHVDFVAALRNPKQQAWGLTRLSRLLRLLMHAN